MKKRTKRVLLLMIASFLVITLVFAVLNPYLIKQREGEMKRYLEMQGYTPIEMVDVDGYTYTATWKVKENKSGEEMLVDIAINQQVLTIKPH